MSFLMYALFVPVDISMVMYALCKLTCTVSGLIELSCIFCFADAVCIAVYSIALMPFSWSMYSLVFVVQYTAI